MLSKDKLNNYSKQGNTLKFKNIYNELKSFLEKNISEKYNFEIYLQGSYGNDTNIEIDSDVDIVIELTSIFSYDISKLSSNDIEKFNKNFTNATISLNEFKQHIINILNRSQYNFIEKTKCIKIISGTPLNADLVICNTYRKYKSYDKYIKGIKLKESTISYPKLHKKNLTLKNQVSNDLKETIRIFKNFKLDFCDSYIKNENNNISSYFVESLIFNVPDSYFNEFNLTNRINNIITYLFDNQHNFNYMKTPCNQKNLFGNSKDQWAGDFAIEFLGYVKLFIGD